MAKSKTNDLLFLQQEQQASKNSNKPLFLLRIKLHRRSEQTKIDGIGGIKIKLKTRTRSIRKIVWNRTHTYFNCFPSL